MLIRREDMDWLKIHQPRMRVVASGSKVIGCLKIAACYDSLSGKLIHGALSETGHYDTYLVAGFCVEIHISELDMNGWPKVYEVGGRRLAIQRRYGIPACDLHFYPEGYACLTIRYLNEPDHSLSSFVGELVEPFFFRLAYVEAHGLEAARADLWPEYAHGMEGIWQHLNSQIYRCLDSLK